VYAHRALLNALAPLIGAEVELGNKAVSPCWADNASEEKIAQWRQIGQEFVKDEMEKVLQEVTAEEYGRLMRKVRPFKSIAHFQVNKTS